MSTDYDRNSEDTDVAAENAVSPVDGAVVHDDTLHDDALHDETLHDDTVHNETLNDETLDDDTLDDETSFTPILDTPGADASRTEVPSAASRTDVPVTGVSSSADPGTSSPDENLLGDTTELMTQWKHAQAEFLDDPHAAITEAADVVAEAAGRLEAALQARRSTWDTNGKPDTETLRRGMLEYRRLFDMLVG